MFCGAGAVAMVALLMWGGWSPPKSIPSSSSSAGRWAASSRRWSAVIIGLLAGGPVGRFKVSAEPRRRDDRSRPATNDPAPAQLQGIAGIAAALASPSCSSSRRARPATGASRAPGSSGSTSKNRRVRATVANTAPPPNPPAPPTAPTPTASPPSSAPSPKGPNDDYETRLAAARAHAERLRLAAQAATDPGRWRSSASARLSHSHRRAAQAASEDRLPPADALIATEQAIQLDELIKWVRRQAAVDNNAPAAANLPRRLAGDRMKPDRLNALTDGVVAIVLTIMVLELKVPEEPTLHAVMRILPLLAAYLLAFIYVAIYWNNHHHMMQSARKVTGTFCGPIIRCCSA